MHKHLPTRWDFQHAWYFVTVVTLQRRPYFEAEEAFQVLLDACRSTRFAHPYRLGGLVNLPDHWHALIMPLGNEVIESIVGSIKQRVFHVSRQQGAAKIIRWQPRFMDHRIRSEKDFAMHVEYIRLNPCKHQLVAHEGDPWPWRFLHGNPFA